MKILLVVEKNSHFVASRIEEEILKKGHELIKADYNAVSFKISDSATEGFINGDNIEDLGINAAILRKTNGLSGVYKKALLAKELMAKNIFVVNGYALYTWPLFPKLMQNYIFSSNNIPVVPTYFGSDVAKINNLKWDYPLLAKPSLGNLGNGIIKISNLDELENLVARSKGKMLIQKFLTAGEDYRVIVVGGRALPISMKKVARKGAVVTNLAQGGIAVKIKTTPQLARVAEQANNIFKLDYSGVDIMYDNNDIPHVLEVNRSANFRGFEESTGINVAGEVVKMIERKIL